MFSCPQHMVEFTGRKAINEHEDFLITLPPCLIVLIDLEISSLINCRYELQIFKDYLGQVVTIEKWQ